MIDYTASSADWYKVTTRFPREAMLLRRELKTMACFASVSWEQTTASVFGREDRELTCDVDGGGRKWFAYEIRKGILGAAARVGLREIWIDDERVVIL